MQTQSLARRRYRVCLLGGTGFVGRHLAARLVGADYELRILTRDPVRQRNLLVLPTAKLVKVNVLDPATLRREFAGCDAVINLVGILNESGRHGGSFREAHVELPRLVVEACAAAGVPRLLHMSALKADAAAPSEYLRSKAKGEAIVKALPPGKLAVTIFQPSVIFGPDDDFINRFAKLLRLPLLIFPLPRPKARFAPVFVGDVVEAFTRALRDRQSFGKTYQLCGPRAYSMRELLTLIARTMGVRRRIVGLSDTLSRLLARIGDFLPGAPFTTDNNRSLGVHSLCDQDGLARLGITATSGEAVMPQYLAGIDEQTRYNRYRKFAGRS